MRALLSTRPGGPRTLTLTEAPDPTPGPGEAVVRIKACGVNFPDVLIIEDKYQTKPQRPFSPGGEIAGVVEAVGEGVASVKVGDRVLGLVVWGGMAERIAVKADQLFQIPDEMPFDVASGFILTYGTSYYALKQRAQLKSGERLLILGAAGGVGLAAIQLGKAMGAQVTAAVSSQEKADFCLQQGADDTVIYERGELSPDARKALSAQFKAAAKGEGFDVVYDSVGGDYAEPAVRSLAWEGRYLVVGFAAGQIPKIPLNLTLLKGSSLVGVWWGEWVSRNPDLHRQNNADLFGFYRDGRIRPFVSRTFTLEDGAEAIEHLAGRQAVGKVVVTVP